MLKFVPTCSINYYEFVRVGNNVKQSESLETYTTNKCINNLCIHYGSFHKRFTLF